MCTCLGAWTDLNFRPLKSFWFLFQIKMTSLYIALCVISSQSETQNVNIFDVFLVKNSYFKLLETLFSEL